MPITIVNRHYPPNVGITGEAAWDLSKYLIEQKNIEVHIVHIERNYHGGGAVRNPVGITHPVKSIYVGNHPILKNVSGFLDGILLCLKAFSIKKGPIIFMTSPPMLPFWGSLLNMIFKRKWSLWSMDLFPEGFQVTKNFNPNSFIYRAILKLNYLNSPDKLIALGKNQSDFITKKYKNEIKDISILPCGVLLNQEKSAETPSWKTENADKIIFGYVGNLGQAHSDEFLIAFIKQFNAENSHLVLVLYGEKAANVLNFAKDFPGISILKNLPRNQIHHIDVQLVSLLPPWTHIAVPSKAISAICSGNTILFYGNEESDTWQFNKNAGWHINPKLDLQAQITTFLSELNQQAIELKKLEANKIHGNLKNLLLEAYEEISKF